jgi:murein DD-endopeptidase MepM/ murein hydrolase activator NlpD
MRHKKYILDLADLQYKRVRLPWKHKFIRGVVWIAGSIAVSILYLTIFENQFGSPKEKKLYQDIENLKLKYSLLNREYDDEAKKVNFLRLSDEKRYRPVLVMDSLPESIRQPGFGGVDRYKDIEGFTYSPVMISTRQKIDALTNMARVQEESFNSIESARIEWQRVKEFLPMICPIDPAITRGDGFNKFREVHPVTGKPEWHFGQDFNAPYGTNVFATGNGTVTVAGWSSNGFGNYVMIDHGYGYQTIYGHLSKINVSVGLNVKRGDLLGLSGNSGSSSGPHLHYQIEYFGKHANPINFFSDDLTPQEYRDMITLLSSKSTYR